jgi:two-component system, OmpR family, sensor histidine kinase KdpD
MTLASIFRCLALALALVVAMTAFILAGGRFINSHYLVVLYLCPIAAAMIRGGFIAAAITTVVCGIAAAFFFYEPVFSFYVADPEETVELILFGILGLIIAYLITILYETNFTGRYSA